MYQLKAFPLFFLLFVMFNLQGQNNIQYSILTIPEELKEGANTVVRKDVGEFIVHDYRTATETKKVVVTRLNSNAGQSYLVVGYDMYSKVTRLKVNLYDSMGQLIRKVKKDEIHDYAAFDGVSIYSDNRYKYVDLKYGEFPYTIEYEYEIEHSSLVGYPRQSVVSRFETSVQDWKFRLQLPPELNTEYRSFNYDFTLNDLSTSDKKIYEFSATNFKPLKEEELAPAGLHIFPKLFFTPETFGGKDYRGSMKSWEAFGKFMYELNKEHNNLSPEMIAKVKEMTADATTDQEKIHLLYNYLKENMRYVSVQLGIGGWKAFDAAYVEKNKFGDCKALTWFMKSMLEEVDIKSYPALVNAGREHAGTSHPEDFSYPFFNHVILNIPSEETWLECTSNDNPTNYPGSFTDDRNVLLITEEGGRLSRTPVLPAEDNKVYRETKVKIDVGGAAEVTVSDLRTGYRHELLRSLHSAYSQEELEKWFLKNTSLPSCKIEKLDLQVEKDLSKALMQYQVQVPKYGSKGGSRLFVPANCINIFTRSLPKNENRIYPICLPRGYVEEDKIEINLPDGYRVESIPNEKMDLSSEFGTYSVAIEKGIDKITYHRKLEIAPVNVPAERYNELRDFYKKIIKTDKMKLVLVKKT